MISSIFPDRSAGWRWDGGRHSPSTRVVRDPVAGFFPSASISSVCASISHRRRLRRTSGPHGRSSSISFPTPWKLRPDPSRDRASRDGRRKLRITVVYAITGPASERATCHGSERRSGRGSASPMRSGPPGSGIGLSIVKRLSAAMSWHLEFANHPEGGLVASVVIPDADAGGTGADATRRSLLRHRPGASAAWRDGSSCGKSS